MNAERLAVKLPGLDLKNPVIPASGTCWYGQELAERYDLNVLGSLVLKSTTKAPREGNPKPRVAETTAGWMNANGLQNVGVDAVVDEKLPWLGEHYPQLPAIASAAGFSEDEYVHVVQKLSASPFVSAIEVTCHVPTLITGASRWALIRKRLNG